MGRKLPPGRASTSTQVTYKEKVNQLWQLVPQPGRTVAMAAKICTVAYGHTSALTSDKTYVGHMEVEGEEGEVVLKQVSGTVLDNHKLYKALQGTPLNDDYVDEAFGPEYATNLVHRGGALEMITIKYLGMELLHGQTMVLDIITQGGFNVISDFFMEFIWNVMHLRLRSAAAIHEFVEMECDPRFYCFLLDDEDVQKLAKEGTHEVFAESDVEDTLELLRDITASAKAMFNM
jgi:hypothetical protein